MKTIQILIFLAGLGQIGLALCSVAIPKILNWKAEMAKVKTLIKQIFWVYAVYILVTNLSFGLLSVFAWRDLTGHSVLAMCLTGFIMVHWVSRLFIQFLYFDRASFPTGTWLKIGEVLLVTLFIFLSFVYSYAFYLNF